VASPEVVWHSSKNGPSISSPLLVGDELYYVSDGGIFSSVNARTGEPYYRDRLGGKFTSSPLSAGDRIYVSSREGVTTVLKSGKIFEVLAKNQLDGAILGSPAAVDGALILRTDKAVYRLGKK
jgi:outer membrane protein assembly factor BamB